MSAPAGLDKSFASGIQWLEKGDDPVSGSSASRGSRPAADPGVQATAAQSRAASAWLLRQRRRQVRRQDEFLRQAELAVARSRAESRAAFNRSRAAALAQMMRQRRAEEAAKWPSMENEPWSAGQLNYLLQQAGLTPGLIDQWASSPERSWYIGRRFFRKPLGSKKKFGIYSWVGVGLALIVAGALIASFVDVGWWPNANAWGWALAGAGAVVLGWCTVPYWAARRAFSARRRAAARYSVDAALDELRMAMQAGQSTRTQLARMFELNRKQLDEYQEITKSQQRTAFILTWSAAVAAFLILIIGSAVALQFADNPEERFIAGGLTALGSLLSAFLGAVFFRGHDHAANQLNHYYLEPSLTGRILAVERMLDHLPNSVDKTETAKLMMQWIRDLEFPPKTQDGTKKPEAPKNPRAPKPADPNLANSLFPPG